MQPVRCCDFFSLHHNQWEARLKPSTFRSPRNDQHFEPVDMGNTGVRGSIKDWLWLLWYKEWWPIYLYLLYTCTSVRSIWIHLHSVFVAFVSLANLLLLQQLKFPASFIQIKSNCWKSANYIYVQWVLNVCECLCRHIALTCIHRRWFTFNGLYTIHCRHIELPVSLKKYASTGWNVWVIKYTSQESKKNNLNTRKDEEKRKSGRARTRKRGCKLNEWSSWHLESWW